MIMMKTDASQEQVTGVVREIKKFGLRAYVFNRKYKTMIGIVGDEKVFDFPRLQNLLGVKELLRIQTPYKLISREYNRLAEADAGRYVVKVGNIEIGGEEPVYIAGPCSIESRDQLFRITEGVKKAGAQILRGGVFKLKTSVYSFQGLGANSQEDARAALSWLRDAGKQFDMLVVTKVRGKAM